MATPRELYEQPVNLFVAGFIGSPSMNFMPGGVDGDLLHLPVADVTLQPEVAERVAGHDIVIAGIRPEQFEDARMLDDAARAQGVEFTAKIDVIEWLGAEQYAYIPFEAPPEIRKPLAELAEELDSEQIRTQLVVVIDAASQLQWAARRTSGSTPAPCTSSTPTPATTSPGSATPSPRPDHGLITR